MAQKVTVTYPKPADDFGIKISTDLLPGKDGGLVVVTTWFSKLQGGTGNTSREVTPEKIAAIRAGTDQCSDVRDAMFYKLLTTKLQSVTDSFFDPYMKLANQAAQSEVDAILAHEQASGS